MTNSEIRAIVARIEEVREEDVVIRRPRGDREGFIEVEGRTLVVFAHINELSDYLEVEV